MVIYDKGQLGQAARKSGFVRDTFEKVLRLKEILIYLNTDESVTYFCIDRAKNSNGYF